MWNPATASVTMDTRARAARQRAQKIAAGLQKAPFAVDHPKAAKDLSEDGKFFETLMELCTECRD